MSKKEKFRLQKILNLRRHQEQQIRFQLAKVAGECAHLEQVIQGLDEHQRNSFQHHTEAGTNVTLMMAYELLGRRLTKEMAENKQSLSDKKDHHQSIKQTFLEAQKKRKVLENLQKKQDELSRQEENRRQTLIVDDLTSAAYILAKKGLTHGH